MIKKPERKPPPDFTYAPPDQEIEVLFRDAYFLVINKPSGLLSVPGRKIEHIDSLEKRICDKIPAARIVHRLDMDTSGVMIMALDKDTHRNLGLQFERRKTEKEYIARIWGTPDAQNGTINLPLRCDWPNRPLQMVDHENGRPAQTEWTILEKEDGGVTRVSLKPVTGRTHQLRVHMAEIDHPILGDDFYAHAPALNAAPRLMLHAHRLKVHHPEDGREIWFEARCPF